MITQSDREILRRLAGEVAEIAALPVQEEKRGLWRRLNAVDMVRPMVAMDQVCWHEMNVNDELTLQCEDAECRDYEDRLRKTLYRWRHFRGDMVVDPSFGIPRAVTNTGFGITLEQDIAVKDESNDVVSHAYHNQFQTDADLDRIKEPVVTHDSAETAGRMERAHEIFDGTLQVHEAGIEPYLSVWDPIATWMGVEGVLYALIDRPDYIRELARRVVVGYMSSLDQLEEQGLLVDHQSWIHCTGAFTDDLPSDEFDPKKPLTKDLWMFGLAQMFSTISPEMFDEFEIEMCMPLFERFGLVYYGCCDPLEGKMDQVRKIPGVRKISMSPWVDEEKGATEIGSDYVYSRKPNPALLAWSGFDESAVRDHLQTSVDVCRRHGCSIELILKDISTVKYEPQRLWRWSEIAMEVAQG